ncbi:MAG: hypothetical protein QOD57_5122, partial [Actinomycetota bacterium]|nr:hypothetical protein [Actinomycetota bacterium]
MSRGSSRSVLAAPWLAIFAGLLIGGFGLPAVLGHRAGRSMAGAAPSGVFEGPVPRPTCGPGSRPETARQGEITASDRASGRSSQGYTCNLALVGNYAGEGAEWQLAWHGHCAYYDTRFSGQQTKRGTVVVDAADPAHPRFSTNLTTPAMLDPWETLKVNEARGLLAGVFVGDLQGAAFFDVYDVKGDCSHPKLLSSVPVNGLAHEGGWAPDGLTYYATGLMPGTVTAIDVTDPTAPKPLTTFAASAVIHGLGVSSDGKRLYLAHINEDFLSSVGGNESVTDSNGLGIYDVSGIATRAVNPEVHLLGEVT